MYLFEEPDPVGSFFVWNRDQGPCKICLETRTGVSSTLFIKVKNCPTLVSTRYREFDTHLHPSLSQNERAYLGPL